MINLNVGIFGHVDSGKTAIAKLISSTPSTACFDKNTQSQERGITIDLGFSSLQVKFPQINGNDFEQILQFTFVDCPGHSSLIKTIIGGAQIIDIMMLIIDCQKGVQAQTAECIVIGEITCSKGIVVLNKVDLLPQNERKNLIDQNIMKLQKIFSTTKFKDIQIIPLSVLDSIANPNSEYNINNVIQALRQLAYVPERDKSGPFIMNIDHCFNIKGHGTVLTGTLLSGHIKLNEGLEIPILKMTRKIKSIQMYKKPVAFANQGDRIGVCVTQFDSSIFERGLVCSADKHNFEKRPLVCADTLICSLSKVRYYTEPLKSNTKFHVTIGHVTHLAKVEFVKLVHVKSNQEEYFFQEYYEENKSGSVEEILVILRFDTHVNSTTSCDGTSVVCAPGFLYIASRLDKDTGNAEPRHNVRSDLAKLSNSRRLQSTKRTCRLAFYGKIIKAFLSSNEKEYASFTTEIVDKIYKIKCKVGLVERFHDDETLIVKAMFKRESSSIVKTLFAYFRVEFYDTMPLKHQSDDSEKELVSDLNQPLFYGTIESSFGQSGKIKVHLEAKSEIDHNDDYPTILKPYFQWYSSKKLSGKMNKLKIKNTTEPDHTNPEISSRSLLPPIWCLLRFKRFIYDDSKKPHPL